MNIQAMIDRLNEQRVHPEKEIFELMEGLETIGIFYDDDQMTRWSYEPTTDANICQCGSPNYGYGYAKCFDCGKLKYHNEDDQTDWGDLRKAQLLVD